MTEMNDRSGLERLCASEHYNNLDFEEMRCIDIVHTSDYGDLHIYKCDSCGEIDIWIADEMVWIRDYEYRVDEFVGLIGEYE